MSDPRRFLILGAAGQVGRELLRSFAGCGEIVGVDRETVDLAQTDRIRDLLRRVSPHVILNAAAYTAVDRAESEADLAFAVNAEVPRILAEEARQSGALLVHYSTDYVFDGSKAEPWVEEDQPNPLNAYGASKLAGETAIRQTGVRCLTFRTSWVYGPHGNNFLLTMLRLARERESLSIVSDQHGAPTSSIELANATRAVVDGILAGRYGSPGVWAGVYHMTCSGSTTWYGFAQAIFARTRCRLGRRTPALNPIASAEYPTRAKRPRNSVLSNARLNARFGVRLPPWETALDTVIGVLPES